MNATLNAFFYTESVTIKDISNRVKKCRVMTMTLTYMDCIYLECLEKFRGERTASAVFHLLKGKKSSQTIQDSKLFSLSRLFGMFPDLSRKEFDAAIGGLVKSGWLLPVEGDVCRPNPDAVIHKENRIKERPLPEDLDGTLYSQAGVHFWKRTVLLAQVLSHASAGSARYLPVIKDEKVQRWVKSYLKGMPFSKEELAFSMYQEMQAFLKRADHTAASVWVYQLSSKSRIGFTYQQLAEKFNEDEVYIRLLFWGLVHRFLKESAQNIHTYPILHAVSKDLTKSDSLTESASKTLHLIRSGKSVDAISDIRRLKRSTIEDHIVEISLNDPGFDISMFLEEEGLALITRKIQELNTHQLRIVKEALNDRFSYFQIRLAYTRT